MHTILEKLKETKIVVIGDVMLDRYIAGVVERISPEAPVPVVLVQEESHVLGGAGNVAANLCKLNINHMHLFCCIGDDTFGEAIVEELIILDNNYKNSVTTYFYGPQTTVKTRILATNHQIVRFDREQVLPLHNTAADTIINTITENKNNINAILISDYGKGMITTYLLAELYNIVGEQIPICIDPSPKTNYPYMPEAIVLPNTKERKEMGKDTETNFKAVVETAGAEGIVISKWGTPDTLIKAIEVSDIVDTVGAGDTVTAVFTAAIATGAPIYDAAVLANLAASVVVRHAKTYAVSYNELYEAISSYYNPQTER
jgi:rfaE bifunctional protein kinase chain/domain